MFFKRIALAVTVALSFGCAKRDVPASKPVVVPLNGGECIAKFSAKVSDFANGKLTPDQISAFWNCLSNSIQEFERLTAGPGGGDNYTPESLRQFIEHYFMRGHISDGVLEGLMELKRILLSGTNKTVTRSELKHLDALFMQLKAMSLDVQPYARVIFRKDKAASDAQIRQASIALQSAMTRLAGWLSNENQDYQFSQLSFFMDKLTNWLLANGNSPQDVAIFKQVADILPEVKVILVAGDDKSIRGHEWLSVCTAISRGLSFYLAAVNGLDENLDAALTRESLPEMISQALTVINQSVTNHSDHQIPLSEFQALFKKLEDLKWLPSSMSADSVMKFWMWVLRRPLGDGVSEPRALNLAQLGNLQQLFLDWQTLLFAKPADTSPLVQNFAAVLNSSPPLEWDLEGRLVYPVQPHSSWWRSSRVHMMWPYVLLNLIKNSYGGAPANALDEKQMATATHEVLPLLQNFGWFKTTKETIGSRILREADLFTPGANGDGKIDLAEGVRYLNYLMSSLRTAQIWLAQADEKCGSHEAGCVRELIVNPNSPVLANMPRLQALIKKWPHDQVISYTQTAEGIVLGGIQTGSFERSDLLMVAQIFQYVEQFYQRFDIDHDESIEYENAMLAFPLFEPTLTRLLASHGLEVDDMSAFFTFLFKYGDSPFGKMLGVQIAYNHWRWHREEWAFGADRNILLNILYQLSQL